MSTHCVDLDPPTLVVDYNCCRTSERAVSPSSSGRPVLGGLGTSTGLVFCVSAIGSTAGASAPWVLVAGPPLLRACGPGAGGRTGTHCRNLPFIPSS